MAPALDLDRRPILVFWETTRACGLACRHCRASAIHEPLPGQLTPEEGIALVDALAGFEAPRPVLVATGGDVLERRDLMSLIARATERKVPVALAPSVTPLLTDERAAGLRAAGVKVMSISLDGATASTHEGIRGIDGHFEKTLEAIRRLRRHGITVQVNTVVMRDNVHELPAVFELIREAGATIWEVFFLIHVGRGVGVGELTPEQNEDVCHFLVDASQYGMIVRTVEGPFFRRVVAARRNEAPQGAAPPPEQGPLYAQLAAELRTRLGEPSSPIRAQTKGTRDGRGIVFIGHDGEIHPSGFLPLTLGNVREDDIVDVYREHPLLKRIRAADFSGRCGACAFREICGGSRARAYASSGDPLGEDTACVYMT